MIICCGSKKGVTTCRHEQEQKEKAAGEEKLENEQHFAVKDGTDGLLSGIVDQDSKTVI